MSSQILILKLLFYFREPATEHVILALAPGYHIIIAYKSQISAIRLRMVCVLLLSCFTCSDSKGSWQFRVSRQQTNTSSITLDHAHLPINVLSSINRFNCEWTRVTAGAYNRNINKRQARKLIWPRKPCYGSQILQQQILLLEGKFDGLQKLRLANYTHCTVMIVLIIMYCN